MKHIKSVKLSKGSLTLTGDFHPFELTPAERLLMMDITDLMLAFEIKEAKEQLAHPHD